MTDLRQSLIKADFSHLKAVAERWEFSPFDPPDVRSGLEQLVEALLKPDQISLITEVLDGEEKSALLWLEARGGQEHLDRFSREFGEIREIGAGKLEREKPHLKPISTAESLYYRALIARGFLETEEGSREFIYVPDDLRSALTHFLGNTRGNSISPGFTSRQAAARECKIQETSGAVILDQLCTLLAGTRMSLDPAVQLPDVSEIQLNFYGKLSQVSGLLDDGFTVHPEGVREFFELSREQALLKLWNDWLSAEDLNDLDLLPGITVEGDPEMDPAKVRSEVLEYLHSLDPGGWWSIESFISRIKELNPDLIRTSGDYDAWFIKDTETDRYLKGFKHWDEVEGALTRYLLTGPLHWLGFLDLGYPDEEGDPLAFKLSSFSGAYVNGTPPPIKKRKPEVVQIRAKGEIRITENVPHRTRYQVARFCDWFPVKAEAYLYALTPASLGRAEEQGLRVAHLLTLLKKNLDAIPPNILAALERYEKSGTQASIAQQTVLRLGSPQILKALKKSKAGRYIQEQIGPTAVIVKEGGEDKIREALVELGFFLETGD